MSVILSEIQLLQSWRQTAVLQKIGFWRIVTLSSDCREKAHPLVKCGNDNPWPKGDSAVSNTQLMYYYDYVFDVINCGRGDVLLTKQTRDVLKLMKPKRSAGE